VRFVVDANLSFRLAAYLREAGHDAVHVMDVGLLRAADPEIMAWAQQEQRVIVSSDTDFGTLLARQQTREPSFVLLRQLNERKPDEQAALLLANLDAVAGDLAAGAVVTLTPRHLRVRPLPIRPVS
jgi:predicted nuclease of predicted toxin-antitoxin system